MDRRPLVARVGGTGLVLGWATTWIATRALMVAAIGYWRPEVMQFYDVYNYEGWARTLLDGDIPADDGWQYPPGAALLLLVPHLLPLAYPSAFVAFMLLLDAAIAAMLAWLGRGDTRHAGVWFWLIMIPTLVFGGGHALPLLRYDMAPTFLAILAFTVLARPLTFGAIAGLGASLKVWPWLVLVAQPGWKHLRIAILGCVGAVLVVTVGVWLAMDDPVSVFFTHQTERGLQIEAVAATPWYLRAVITGEDVPFVGRSGTNEIPGATAGLVSDALLVLTVAAFCGIAAWWVGRSRLVASGRLDLADPAVGADAALTAVLLFVVLSRVLSPQFMVWLVGMAALALTSSATRMTRPVLLVALATVLTAVGNDDYSLVLRNLVLIVAAALASWTMVMALRPGNAAAGLPPMNARA